MFLLCRSFLKGAAVHLRLASGEGRGKMACRRVYIYIYIYIYTKGGAGGTAYDSGKRDSMHHHLLEVAVERQKLRQKLLYTTPSGWWWWYICVYTYTYIYIYICIYNKFIHTHMVVVYRFGLPRQHCDSGGAKLP